MEERTDESPNPKSTDLEDGLPMDRGFVVGAVVGLLILVTIPILAKHFRDSGESDSSSGTEISDEVPAEATGSTGN